jgi:molybdopterin converting factor small subunit
MKVSVRYMAQVRQATGVDGESLELAAPCTLAELLGQLAARHGERLRNLLLLADGAPQPSILLFLNAEQTQDHSATPLKDGDVLTILAPMAGG